MIPHPIPQSRPYHRWITDYALLGVACMKVLPTGDTSRFMANYVSNRESHDAKLTFFCNNTK